MRFLLLALVSVMSASILAAPLLSDSVLIYVSQSFTDFTIADADTSDLDGDNLPEVALLLAHSGDNIMKIVVLKESQFAHVIPVASSKLFFNCQHGTEFGIDKKSLTLACFHSGDSTAYSFDVLQFTFRGGRLRLTDEELSQETEPNATTDHKFPDTKTSINYLTGDVITTTKYRGRNLNQIKMKLTSNEQIPRYLEDFGGFFSEFKI